ncbi:MAG: hypothetical protein ACPG8A_14015, partial [Psychrobium sp.]
MKKLSVVMLGILGVTGCMSLSNHVSQPSLDNASSFIQPSADFAGHWLTPQLILLPKRDTVTSTLIVGGDKPQSVSLKKVDLPTDIAKRFPHLSDFQGYALSQPTQKIKQWLTQPLIIKQLDNQQQASFSRVQFGNLLDVLYTSGSQDANELTDLGSTTNNGKTQFKLWAPTAQQVSVLIYDKDQSGPAQQIKMQFNNQTGAWTYQGTKDLSGHYYQYQISVYHP